MSTINIGYDVGIEIQQKTYHIQTDHLGQSFGFAMNESARERLKRGIAQVFPNRNDIAAVDIEPGYLRVRVEPSRARETTPQQFVTALGDLADWYNEHHAKSAEIDGIQTGDSYVNVYRPEGAEDPEGFVESLTGDDRAPDSDGPVYSLSRDGDLYQMPDRHLAYRVIVPLDPAMYTTNRKRRHAFEWGDFERERIQSIAKDLPIWPGDADAVQELTIYPEYVDVELHYGHTKVTPQGVGKSIHKALDRYNQMPGTHTRLSTEHKDVLPPSIMFGSPIYVSGIAAEGRTAGDWIQEQGLDEIDGEPVDPTEEEEYEESGGMLSSFI